MVMCRSSVVVQIIEQFYVLPGEAEGHAPVAADGDSPVLRQVALEQMQAKARHVCIIRVLGLFQHSQNTFEALGMIGANATGGTRLIEHLQAFVLEGFNHASSVNRLFTNVKCSIRSKIAPPATGSGCHCPHWAVRADRAADPSGGEGVTGDRRRALAVSSSRGAGNRYSQGIQGAPAGSGYSAEVPAHGSPGGDGRDTERREHRAQGRRSMGPESNRPRLQGSRGRSR